MSNTRALKKKVNSIQELSSRATNEDEAIQEDESPSEKKNPSPQQGPKDNSLMLYFRDIARMPLLSREEEIQIAKRIEIGERVVAQVLLRYPLLIQHVIYLGEQLQSGEVEIGDVIKDSDEDDMCRMENLQVRVLCEKIGRISELNQKLKSFKIEGRGDSKVTKKQEKILQQMQKILTTLKLNEKQIDNIIQILETYVDRIERAEQTIEDCEKKSGFSRKEINKLLRSAKKARFKKLQTIKEKIQRASREIRHVELESQTMSSQLKKDLKRVIEARTEAKTAKNELVEANLRLVISIANKYGNRGLQLLDLLQEGNMGLMKAVDKFDYHLGYKFSTYATWWIWQAITRAINNQAQTIRFPVHMKEIIDKTYRASQALAQELCRKPTLEEISERMELPMEQVKKVLELVNRRQTISLDTPIGDENSYLRDFIEDKRLVSPETAAMQRDLEEQTQMILSTLTPREERILRRRFGIGDKEEHTLQEVGLEFGLTRERIRQIQAKTLKKLQHPSRSRSLAFPEE